MEVGEGPVTVVEAFLERASHRPHRALWYERAGRRWRSTSWEGARDLVEDLAAGLAALGVQSGERVGLLGPNRPIWVATDYAIQMIGAVSVPLYPTSPAGQWRDILVRSQARICCVDGEDVLARLEAVDAALSHVVSLHTTEDADERVIGTGSLAALGAVWLRAHPDELERRGAALGPGDPATVIFTSGTTGVPKGVVLTHGNLLAAARAGAGAVSVRRREILLSYMPLSHAFERVVTTILPLVTPSDSWTCWFVADIAELPAALRSVRPTIVVGVPLFWQRLRGRITAELESGLSFRRRAARLLFAPPDRNSGSLSRRIATLARPVVRRLGRAVLSKAGLGRCWYAVSGAAPIDAETQLMFKSLGLPIHQGWGLTETTALATVQRPDDVAIGVVGAPLDGVELLIDPDGEVLVRGPNVFPGYLDEPPPGSPALDADGFLHTGDLGELVEDGRLRILDRMDDMIVTSGGRKIAPRQIESRLDADPLIAASMVLGDDRPYLVALLALDSGQTSRMVPDSGDTPLWAHPEVEARVSEVVAQVNESIAPPEQVHRWTVLPLGFPDEALTPTLKIRRRVVEELLAPIIEEMYG